MAKLTDKQIIKNLKLELKKKNDTLKVVAKEIKSIRKGLKKTAQENEDVIFDFQLKLVNRLADDADNIIKIEKLEQELSGERIKNVLLETCNTALRESSKILENHLEDTAKDYETLKGLIVAANELIKKY